MPEGRRPAHRGRYSGSGPSAKPHSQPQLRQSLLYAVATMSGCVYDDDARRRRCAPITLLLLFWCRDDCCFFFLSFSEKMPAKVKRRHARVRVRLGFRQLRLPAKRVQDATAGGQKRKERSNSYPAFSHWSRAEEI